MYDSKYLASLFNVSVTTIRGVLRALGLGVGTTGTYKFGADEIDAVVNEIAGLLKRGPFDQSTPMASGGLVSINRTPAPEIVGLTTIEPSTGGSAVDPLPSRTVRLRNFALDNKTSIIYLLIGLIAAITGIDLAL